MQVTLSDLDYRKVNEHYLSRERVHSRLRHLLVTQDVRSFAELALGISDGAGNYSASEHGMGALILAESNEQEVFDLAIAIDACTQVNHLPRLIYDHGIHGLKIAIGSEMAMMLNPQLYWVGNVRTIWSHLMVKHNMSQQRANEELKLYHDGDRDSEMDYEVWRDVYLRMEPDMRTLGAEAAKAAQSQGVSAGELRYMWPDAVASYLFERCSVKRPRRT